MYRSIIVFGISSLLIVSCSDKNRTEEEVQRARQATLDSVNMANGRQRVMDSLSAIAHSVPDAVVLETPTYQAEPDNTKHETKHHNPVRSAPAPAGSSTNNTAGGTNAPGTKESTVASTGNGTAASNGTVAGTEEKKKKGLNNAAKGAIIGLGTGAAAGAVLNKENRGKGAVIGGVVGAVGGAVGGAVLDKRKKNKEAEKDSTVKK